MKSLAKFSRIQSTLPISAEAVRLADRILLCVPRGGLNDTLCQIERCSRYAAQFDRQLIIDARRSGIMGQFSDYFSVLTDDIDVVSRVEPQHLALLNRLDCYPAELRGRLHTYRTKRVPEGFCDKRSGALVSFDFSIDYPQPLLVHEQSGGGSRSFELLKRVSLSRPILQEIAGRLSSLPRDYVGVHVRNTDVQTDYETFFRDLYPRTVGRTVLVCSDDPRVVARAGEVFDQATVITTGNPAIDIGQPEPIALHRARAQLNDEQQRTQAINALTDLIALGGAREVFFTKCGRGKRWSGFSLLASLICENKSVISSLLSEPPARYERLQERLHRALMSNSRLQERSKRVLMKNARLVSQLANRDRALVGMRNSWSWSLTAPLRAIRVLLRRKIPRLRP